MEHQNLLAMVAVHYRDSPAINELIDSAAHWDTPPSLVVVIDNSGDLEIRKMPGSAEVIRPGANIGYAAAVNRGIDLASSYGYEHILICTQDARLENSATTYLMETARGDKRRAVVAPLLAFASKPEIVFSSGGTLSDRAVAVHPDQGRPLADLNQLVIREVDWADGAITLVRASAAKRLGGFDEAYFLYVEEVDFQYRVRASGETVVLDTRALGYQEPGNYTLYLKFRNYIYFVDKVSGLRSRRLLTWLLVESAKMILRGRPLQPLWAVRGVIDSKRHRMGPPPSGLLRDWE